MNSFSLGTITDLAVLNPTERLAKGKIAKKIPMAFLQIFNRMITGYEETEYKSGPKFRNGDTLLAKITPCLENGKTALVSILDTDEVAFGSSEFIVMRPKFKSDTNFLYYLAISPLFRKRAISSMEGTSGRKRVNETTLKNQVFQIPDSVGRQNIGEMLSNIDEKIELNNKINIELDGLLKTVFEYWFIQFDFPDVKGNPYRSSGGKMLWNEELKREIPDGWSSKKLNDFIGIGREQINPTTENSKLFKHYSIPSFDSYETYTVEPGSTIKSNKFVVSNNDILVSKLNPWFNRVIYSTNESDQISSTEFVLWRSKNVSLKNYLYMLARNKYFISFCVNSSSGTSHSHRRVNPDVMMSYTIPYNEGVALKYGEIVMPFIEKYFNNKQENNLLKSLRDFLLPMLMNGQVKIIS